MRAESTECVCGHVRGQHWMGGLNCQLRDSATVQRCPCETFEAALPALTQALRETCASCGHIHPLETTGRSSPRCYGDYGRCSCETFTPRREPTPPDPINPPHYKAGGMKALDVIEAFGLSFVLGCAVEYILTAGKNGSALENLKIARWYIDRAIKQHEEAGQ